MKNSSDSMKVIGALIIGAATGATLGVLFAPKKGSKTRKSIVGSAKKMTRNFKEKMDDEIKVLKKKAKKEAEFLKDKGIKIEKEIQKKSGNFKSVIDNQLDQEADALNHKKH
ncbi:YtxH domain-containing protein [Flavobacterium paronense]|uniref:YtxH domain-containing protein n=1 Tax=Flavobacterium paronense TaxID=1392775 RepID=A0ABV5GGC0_9FLAO|nr:YtxH domain-containing protein [Flavobacterium paronense]MDN3677021.1 YtxH domain-containing protein [Flavobacterium paronense]